MSAMSDPRFDLKGRSLRQHAARGTLVNTGFLVGLSLLQLLRGFVLAAFLTAEEYGVWGILVVSLGSLLWLKQVGIGDKFIQQDEPDQEAAFQKAFTLEALFNGAAMLVLAALLPVIAAIYGQDGILAPGYATLLLLPAAALQTPLWIHYRRMEFVRQRALQSIDPVVALVVSLSLAAAGMGYWALVLGTLAGAYATAIAATVTSPYRLRFRFEKSALRSYFSFSWPLFVAAAGGMVIAQASMLASEAKLGLAAAGAVTLAATISQFSDRVDGLISGTLYPAVAAVKDRTETLYESFVKSNRLALMWAVPFGVGLSLFAPHVVDAIGREEWAEATPLLQAFGLTAALGHIGFNWSVYFRARGETRPMAVAQVTAAVVFVAALIPLLGAYGLDGFAIAVGLQVLAHVTVRAFFLRRLFVGFGFLRHALRAILPTFPAVAAVLALRAATDLWPLELAVYLAVTVLATLRLERSLLREAVGYLYGSPATAAAAWSPNRTA
jgi:O-antigen/teichoic acid export membrane protein